MHNTFQIIHTAPKNQLKKFLLDLKPKTKTQFSHFGNITEKNVNSIVEYELKRDDKIKFFTLLDDKLISYSFLTKFDKPSKKSNCILGIVLGDKWQGKEFGKKICQYMINYAWKKHYRKIWLTVYNDNTRAIELYRSLGFEIEGIFMYDEESEGTSRHVISMAIFKNKNFYKNERMRLWNTLEK